MIVTLIWPEVSLLKIFVFKVVQPFCEKANWLLAIKPMASRTVVTRPIDDWFSLELLTNSSLTLLNRSKASGRTSHPRTLLSLLLSHPPSPPSSAMFLTILCRTIIQCVLERVLNWEQNAFWDHRDLWTFPEKPTAGIDKKCEHANGLFPDTKQCDLYYECVDGVAKKQLCPGNNFLARTWRYFWLVHIFKSEANLLKKLNPNALSRNIYWFGLTSLVGGT